MTLLGKICSVGGCNRKHYGHGLCNMHHQRLKKSGKIGEAAPIIRIKKQCSIENCNKLSQAKTFCYTHYSRFIKWGDPLYLDRAENGTGTISWGYRVFCIKNKRAREHRLIMESFLGRQLLPHENVHHKNGNRLDNRLENLEVWSEKQPSGQRIEDKILYAKEILSLYESSENNDDILVNKYEKSSVH